MSGQQYVPAALPRKRFSTHCKRDWVDIEAGLGREIKSCLIGIRSVDCPARSESLYPLRYPTRPGRQKKYKTAEITWELHTLCAYQTLLDWTRSTHGNMRNVCKVLVIEDERIVNKNRPSIFPFTSNQPSPLITREEDRHIDSSGGFLRTWFS